MSRPFRPTRPAAFCFPRVSGDEPAHASSIMTKLRFSPREWGVAYDNEDRDEPQEVFLA